MNCKICGFELAKGERLTADIRETFIFKPAHVTDSVNPAKVSEAELVESRKGYTRTAVATIFAVVGQDPLPEGAFNIKHDYCGVQRTGAGLSDQHPLSKHSIRFARSLTRRASR